MLVVDCNLYIYIYVLYVSISGVTPSDSQSPVAVQHGIMAAPTKIKVEA